MSALSLDEKIRSSWDAITVRVRPLVFIKMHKGIGGHFHELDVRQFPPVVAVNAVEGVCILNCQLQEVLVQLVRPPPTSSGKRIVLDKLIKEVNSAHVPSVMPNDCRALHDDLFISNLSMPSCLPPFKVILCDGMVTCCNHRDQSYAPPTNHKDVTLPPECHLSTRQMLRMLAEISEDSGGSTHQQEGTTGMDTSIPGPGTLSYSSCP